MLSLHRLVPLSIASCLALAAPMTALPSASYAQALGISITVAPPPLPIYAQPTLPELGDIWVPGYWAWGGAGYYWVPGTWVAPPAVGLLWTPGYWAWVNGAYIWNAGYWGPTVGFYGGINYGFGYTGVGYLGGRWENGTFFYNQAVNNFGGRRIGNVYNAPVRAGTARVSFNGGKGGTNARPTAAPQEQHVGLTPLQAQHEQAAAGNRALRATVNHGRPAVAATPHPGTFTGPGVVRARGVTPASAGTARPPVAPHGAQPPHGALQHTTGQRAAPQHAAAPAHPTGQKPAPKGGDQHEHP